MIADSPPNNNLLPGLDLGRYELLAPLGERFRSVAGTLVLCGLVMRDPFGESHRRAIRRRLNPPGDAAGDDGGAGDNAGEPGNGPS